MTKIPKCKMTLTGKHTWVEPYLEKVNVYSVIEHPRRCKYCGLVDDRELKGKGNQFRDTTKKV